MTFLIVMMIATSILVMMNEYIINANNIYFVLEKNIENFYNEAVIIDELKCHLINFHDLEDFDYPDCFVNDFYNGYEINYKNLHFYIEVEDGMIMNYSY